jgi:hypothetical protein
MKPWTTQWHAKTLSHGHLQRRDHKPLVHHTNRAQKKKPTSTLSTPSFYTKLLNMVYISPYYQPMITQILHAGDGLRVLGICQSDASKVWCQVYWRATKLCTRIGIYDHRQLQSSYAFYGWWNSRPKLIDIGIKIGGSKDLILDLNLFSSWSSNLYIWSAHYARSARGWGLFDHQKGTVVRGCFCWPFSLFVTFCYFFYCS